MKNFRIIAFLLCHALVVSAISCGARSGGAPEGASTLTFAETVWDFGKIEEADGPVTHVFSFTNEGGDAIVIESVSVSCGCTAPEYPKKPVKAGEKGEIKVTFDPAMRPGAFSNTVRVTSNAGKNNDVLTVKGEVVPKPRTIEEDYPFVMSDGFRLATLTVNMRTIPQGEEKTATVKYANDSDKDISLHLEATPGSYVTVDAPKTICPGCRGEITVKSLVPGGKMYGSFSARVTPVINGHKEELPLTVSGVVTDNFKDIDEVKAPKARLSSNFRNFGEVKKGDAPSRDFSIFNEGASPLIIRAVEATSGFSTDLKKGTAIEPGGHLKITCSLDISMAPEDGIFIQTLTIITNDPVRPSREIRLAANVKPKE